MFSVEFEARSNLLVSRMIGFWGDAEVLAYRHRVLTIARDGNRVRFNQLVDISEFPTQSQIVCEHLEATANAVCALGRRRVAMVVNSALARMQARRLVTTDRVFFTDERLARQWLAEPVVVVPGGRPVDVANRGDDHLAPNVPLQTEKAARFPRPVLGAFLILYDDHHITGAGMRCLVAWDRGAHDFGRAAGDGRR